MHTSGHTPAAGVIEWECGLQGYLCPNLTWGRVCLGLAFWMGPPSIGPPVLFSQLMRSRKWLWWGRRHCVHCGGRLKFLGEWRAFLPSSQLNAHLLPADWMRVVGYLLPHGCGLQGPLTAEFFWKFTPDLGLNKIVLWQNKVRWKLQQRFWDWGKAEYTNWPLVLKKKTGSNDAVTFW